MKMKVSVVMTYYNGSRFVKELLDSLAEQYEAFNELVIMDDCSQALESQYLNDVVEKSSIKEKVRYIYNKKNLGYAGNFLRGMNEAKGDLLFLCDQDDIWDKHKISLMTEIMEHHLELNLLCCDIKPIYSDEDAPRWDSKNLKEMLDDNSLEYCSDIKRNHHLRRSGCTMCVRKNFFTSNAEYWVEGWAHDDFLWKLAVYSKSCAIYHNVLHLRRLHTSNTSELKVRTRAWRIDELQQMLNQHKSLEKMIEQLPDAKEPNKIVKHNEDALLKRIDFLKSKNPFSWLVILLKYFDTYPRGWKGALMDVYLAYVGTHKS